MGGKKKRAGFNYQHAKTEILAAAVEFVGDVPTEHARPDDDDIKGIAAVVTDLGPSATHPAAENIMGERRLLDVNENLRIRIKAGQHGRLLLAISLSRTTVQQGKLSTDIPPMTRETAVGGLSDLFRFQGENRHAWLVSPSRVLKKGLILKIRL